METVTEAAGGAGVLTLREIARSDAAACHLLSQAVAWPHRVEDWEMSIDLGHGVVAMLGDEIVATALWWGYGADHAMLGSIIVSPQHQGGGIGAKLMEQLFAGTAGRSLMLNATAAGAPLYQRRGFEPCGVVDQYQGEVAGATAPVLVEQERLCPAVSADLPVLAELDGQATGLPREPALQALLAQGEAVILERAGIPVGFSVLRRFGRGVVIGPVVAASETDARPLISYWLHRQEGRFVRLDLTSGLGLEAWLSGFGLASAGAVTTMLRGKAPAATGPARLYALINQSLG